MWGMQGMRGTVGAVCTAGTEKGAAPARTDTKTGAAPSRQTPHETQRPISASNSAASRSCLTVVR